MFSRVIRSLTLLVALVACAPPAEPEPEQLGGPVGIMVMQMGKGLHVVWQDTFTGETGFEIDRKAPGGSFEWLVSLPENTTDHHDGTTEAGATYTYRVRAVSAHGPGAWSSEATETAAIPEPQPPGKPTALDVGHMGSGLHVWWSDNSTDETGFELQRKDGDAEWHTFANLRADTDNRMDSTVHAGTTYTYRVRALGEVPSDWSNETSATP